MRQVEQGKRLVEYNRRKKEELKKLNERINKQEETETNSRESDKFGKKFVKTSIPTGVFITGLFLVGGYVVYKSMGGGNTNTYNYTGRTEIPIKPKVTDQITQTHKRSCSHDHDDKYLFNME